MDIAISGGATHASVAAAKLPAPPRADPAPTTVDALLGSLGLGTKVNTAA